MWNVFKYDASWRSYIDRLAGATEAGRLEFLGRLFATTVGAENLDDLSAVQVLPPFCLFESGGGQVARILEGMERRHVPLNDWVHATLRQPLKDLIANEDRYTLVCDKLEVLMALSYAYHAKRTKDWYWAPPGAFVYRHQNRGRVLQEIEDSISKLKGESPFVRSNLFGETVEACSEGLALFKDFASRVAQSW